MYVSVTFHLVRLAIIFNSTVSYLGPLKIYSVGEEVGGGVGRVGGGIGKGRGTGGGWVEKLVYIMHENWN